MKATLGVVVLAGAVLTAVVLAAAPEGAAPAVPALEAPPQAVVPDIAVAVPADQAAAPVPMAELTFEGGRTVTGRLTGEDDQAVHIASAGGGSIGYQRAAIRNIRRYTIPAGEYAEKAGDLLADQLWKVLDAPGTFVKARQQYLAAIALAPAAADRDRLQAKLASLERERDAWQAEALRKLELQKAKDEADLVRLQKDLTQQQLAALQAFDPRLRQVEQDLRQTKLAILELQDASTRTGQAVDDLVSSQRSTPIYVPYPVIVDPKRPRDDSRHDDDHQDNNNVPKP